MHFVLMKHYDAPQSASIKWWTWKIVMKWIAKKNRAKKIPLSSGIDESSSSDIFEWNQLIHRQAHQMTFDEPQFSMTQKVNVVVTDGNGQIDRQSTNNNSILSSRIIIIFFFLIYYIVNKLSVLSGTYDFVQRNSQEAENKQ